MLHARDHVPLDQRTSSFLDAAPTVMVLNYGATLPVWRRGTYIRFEWMFNFSARPMAESAFHCWPSFSSKHQILSLLNVTYPLLQLFSLGQIFPYDLC